LVERVGERDDAAQMLELGEQGGARRRLRCH